MLFSSITFLYYYLPITLLIYYAVPKKFKNPVLLLASLLFYGWSEPKLIILMILSVTVHFVAGLLIDKNRRKKKEKNCKLYMNIAIIISLVMLGYFKYSNFLISNINSFTGLSLPLLKVTLPIGISFYTFQIISYTVDVYRNDTKVQKNIFHLTTYLALFPQLIAGPIVRYADIAAQLEAREHNMEAMGYGIRRFLIGLSKKVILANSLGLLCSIFTDSNEKTILFYWIYAIAFTLQIYYDFSGYSDMAIGLGKMLGFEFMENFNYPYISTSITEFWRRWHISLGSWFRDYVYIPLGGNRVKKGRLLFNIVVVWMLTGFWHGAAWNFILWGLMFAVLLIFEKIWLAKFIAKLPKVISHTYVLLFVVISFVIFDSTSISMAFQYIKAMFGFGKIPLFNQQTIYYLSSYKIILILSIIGSTPLIKRCVDYYRGMKWGDKALTILEPIVCALLLFIISGYLVDGSFNPFLYFRF